MERNDPTLFSDLQNAIRNEFQDVGPSKPDFSILWRDKDDDWVLINSNEDLLMALEEQDGPLYKLFIEDGNNG